MKLVIFGLTISSSWGNGHATLWRGLCRALLDAGHRVVRNADTGDVLFENLGTGDVLFENLDSDDVYFANLDMGNLDTEPFHRRAGLRGFRFYVRVRTVLDRSP